MTDLTLYSVQSGLDFQLDGDWSALKHLSLHIPEQDFWTVCTRPG